MKKKDKPASDEDDLFEPLRNKKQKGSLGFVCMPCRGAKRKCSGTSPCDRCVEKGLSEAGCVEVVRKKRGPKPKVAKERAVLTGRIAFNVPAALDLEDCQLASQQHMTLSLMLAYASQALRERPGDITTLFNLNIDTYIAIDVNPQAQNDPVGALLNSFVVSASCSEIFDDIISDASTLVGCTLMQLCSGAPQRDGAWERGLLAPGPEQRPFIRRLCNVVEFVSSENGPIDVNFETILFYNEQHQPQWVFMAVMGRVDSSSPSFSSSSTELSGPGDFNLLAFGEDANNTLLMPNDLWLGSNVLQQIDDDIFDLSL